MSLSTWRRDGHVVAPRGSLTAACWDLLKLTLRFEDCVRNGMTLDYSSGGGISCLCYQAGMRE